MTGKAASVIGSDAMTLHRLLGYGPGGYAKEALPYDLLVVDEASMLTWPVLCATLSVMRGHILFVGDVRQLPPVEGEGAFPELLKILPVRDLGAVTSVEVTTVHHWSEEHLLMNLATMVRNCEMEKREWQVLSPIRHSRLGAVHLNQYLQRLTNGDGSPVGEGVWIGDRVMIIRNDYTGERAVYNGEMGYVQGRGFRGALVKMLDGYLVDVPFGDLELAYCMTVHKAQGSRFDTVVFVIPPIAKEFAADERMLYVGLTRGRTATWRYMVSSNQAVRCVASETAVPVSGPPS